MMGDRITRQADSLPGTHIKNHYRDLKQDFDMILLHILNSVRAERGFHFAVFSFHSQSSIACSSLRDPSIASQQREQISEQEELPNLVMISLKSDSVNSCSMQVRESMRSYSLVTRSGGGMLIRNQTRILCPAPRDS